MNLDSLLPNLGEWLRGTGPESDVVVSTRIRLARNLMNFPFINRATHPQKAEIAAKVARGSDELKDAYVLSADTVVLAGGRILPKAEVVDEAAACLRLLSGRAHRVYTSVCLVTPKEAVRERLVETRVRFKRLSRDEFERYLASGEWRGKAGGYAIQGFAGTFVVKLVGSYTNVVGLPLYETVALLDGEGYPVRFTWLNAA